MKAQPTLECVPNFSEGRRQDIIDEIAAATEIAGVKILDVHSDPDHNRSVLTLVGAKEALIEAVVGATRLTIELIDLGEHEGVHPRMGAMDVIPFAPLGDGRMRDAIDAAMRSAERIADEMAIPCFLYGFASIRRHANSLELPDVRRQAFENLTPDFGPSSPHPTAGAICLGARDPLVALNIELDTRDHEIGRTIASKVRERGGGLPYVRALSFHLTSKHRIQVSTNLVRPLETTISEVLEKVATVAEELGVSVYGVELVGLAPRSAFGRSQPEELGIDQSRILENALEAAFKPKGPD